MENFWNYCKSSIGKKQIVASTGLLLILFVIGHLAGNLIIYLGPEAFNKYAEKLAGLRPGLYLIEFGLVMIFLIHIYVTALLVFENYKARSVRYAVDRNVGTRSLAARLMPYTGTIVFAFVIWHLFDFTFIDKHGPRSVLPDGVSYGLYGVVYNSFSNPIHSVLYIVAMFAVGFHLMHGIQSFAQTFGFMQSKNEALIKSISLWVGMLIAVGYSAIPLYVMIDFLKY